MCFFEKLFLMSQKKQQLFKGNARRPFERCCLKKLKKLKIFLERLCLEHSSGATVIVKNTYNSIPYKKYTKWLQKLQLVFLVQEKNG